MKVKLYNYLDFLPYFNKEIIFDDNRSNCMPEKNKVGLVVGIRMDSVELRVGNIIQKWYPFNHSDIVWKLNNKK
jgi:hypothetical protein